MEGRKYDGDKLRYDLLDGPAIAWLVASLTYGATKYEAENWRKVPNARGRYSASLMRHFEAWRAGEDYDPESGLHHLSGVLFAAMCLCALHAPRSMKIVEYRTREALARWLRKVEHGQRGGTKRDSKDHPSNVGSGLTSNSSQR